MARITGRRGRMYVQLLSTDTQAQPVAFLNKWSISSSTDTFEVTAFDDDNKTYLAGLPDAQGTLTGWYDDATVQTYAASRDGSARKMYLYPSTSNNGQYWFGTSIFDFNAEGGVDGAVSISGSWRASGNIQKVG